MYQPPNYPYANTVRRFTDSTYSVYCSNCPGLNVTSIAGSAVLAGQGYTKMDFGATNINVRDEEPFSFASRASFHDVF